MNIEIKNEDKKIISEALSKADIATLTQVLELIEDEGEREEILQMTFAALHEHKAKSMRVPRDFGEKEKIRAPRTHVKLCSAAGLHCAFVPNKLAPEIEDDIHTMLKILFEIKEIEELLCGSVATVREQVFYPVKKLAPNFVIKRRFYAL
jgi:hypothetical protein